MINFFISLLQISIELVVDLILTYNIKIHIHQFLNILVIINYFYKNYYYYYDC